MTPNKMIDEAQVEAILGGGQEQVNRYVVSTLSILIAAEEAQPAETDRKIAEHQASCRGQSRKTIYGFIGVCGACVGLATPYILEVWK